MRYHELKEARGHVENALAHLFSDMSLSGAMAKAILQSALRLIRLEIKSPEKFNLDGTLRGSKFYDSGQGPYRKSSVETVQNRCGNAAGS